MNHNLVRDWSDQCSKPQTPFLSFYSPESETLIFEGGDFLRIFCQAGLRAIGAEWTLHHNTVKTSIRSGNAIALPPNRFEIRVETTDR